MVARDTKVDQRSLSVCLLGGFRFQADGTSILLPDRAQRLLAFLALRGQPVRRSLAAEALWPAVTEDRASASLRSALARLGSIVRPGVVATTKEIGLSSDVTIDLDRSRDLANRLALVTRAPSPDFASDVDDIDALSSELLPGWYDDWVVVEAEDWRQVRLHALDALAARLCEQRRYANAAMAALAGVQADPLRESPRAALIRVHLAEGNPSEALREFTNYEELLRLELGIEPTQHLRSLVIPLLPAVVR
jgi:DNA-binding SARP family transcriptional activator